jgi:uncharacterized phage infection (PIP) family protein YhgE
MSMSKSSLGLSALTCVLLIVLAGNTWLQLGLQDRIASDSKKLKETLDQSAAKSEQMNKQLETIAVIKQKTNQLQHKITKILNNTGELEGELIQLDQVVASIADHVEWIGKETNATTAGLNGIKTSLANSAGYLLSMAESNQKIRQSLANMVSTQKEINKNLEEMNDKTDFIPPLRGKEQ